jgi:hypothetical protein
VVCNRDVFVVALVSGFGHFGNRTFAIAPFRMHLQVAFDAPCVIVRKPERIRGVTGRGGGILNPTDKIPFQIGTDSRQFREGAALL